MSLLQNVIVCVRVCMYAFMCFNTVFIFCTSHDSCAHMKTCNPKCTHFMQYIYRANDKSVHWTRQQQKQCNVVLGMYFLFGTYKIQDQSWRAVQMVNGVTFIYWISMSGVGNQNMHVVWGLTGAGVILYGKITCSRNASKHTLSCVCRGSWTLIYRVINFEKCLD